MLDGEGCITIRDNKQVVMVAIANTYLPMLLWLKENFGGKVEPRGGQNPRWKPVWYWRLTCRKAERFLVTVRPYLQIKTQQADVALALRKLIVRQGTGFIPVANLHQRTELVRQLHVLNQRGATKIA